MIALAVTKRLPGFTLDVSWEVEGPVVALFGPSGAGKTLTLDCLAGLVRPDAGRITVNGRVLFDAAAGVDLRPQARRLGYVFQGYALFPHLTVAENVAFGLPDRPRAERRRRAVALLERLGIAALADRAPRELSGGEQQRVALARALAPDPEVLLLDEPLSALDAPLRRQLREELARLIREWGKTVVLVTHDLAEAYQLGDRLVVCEAGRVVQVAPKAELLSCPASEAVARLVGVRNIVHGTVVRATAERVKIAWRGHTIEAVNSPLRPYLAPPGTPVAFFVRPESVRLIRKDRSGPDPAHHMNLLTGTLVGELDQGTTWTLLFRLDAPGEPSQGTYDLEIEVPRLVYEILDVARDRQWAVSMHRGALQVLPT
ncbi:MAG: ABC transporter ATP-binding protein [Candidatus Rokubacteria bacterium]|nr:ABC transporter ATP-binding protein [Candidatus Rokubacteria bacterium]